MLLKSTIKYNCIVQPFRIAASHLNDNNTTTVLLRYDNNNHIVVIYNNKQQIKNYTKSCRLFLNGHQQPTNKFSRFFPSSGSYKYQKQQVLLQLTGLSTNSSLYSSVKNNKNSFYLLNNSIRSLHTTTKRLTEMSSKSGNTENPQNGVVPIDEAKRFIVDCFTAVNTPYEHGMAMANLLIEADYRGHFSHGMNRLEMYINDIGMQPSMCSATPKILSETPATAWVDGCNGLGAVIGNYCMDLAIEKAKAVGVGWVTARRSNHYGIAGWYSIRAQKQGMIGISMTNTSPFMSPTRGIQAALGTNPISVAAPGGTNGDDSFVLDMATTAVAVGKVEIQKRKGEPCPIGWAQDRNGRPTTDANLAYSAGCLMPLGGSELTSGYKGYGLGAMVEIFCGILAGAKYATNIRKWSLDGSDCEADLGQMFVAINPNCFAPGFGDRVHDLNEILRNMPSVDPEKPILVAGDPERMHMTKIDSYGGINYIENQLQTCNKLAIRLNVKPLTIINCSKQN